MAASRLALLPDEANLFEYADEQLVDLVVDGGGHLDVLAVVLLRRRLAVCNNEVMLQSSSRWQYVSSKCSARALFQSRRWQH